MNTQEEIKALKAEAVRRGYAITGQAAQRVMYIWGWDECLDCRVESGLRVWDTLNGQASIILWCLDCLTPARIVVTRQLEDYVTGRLGSTITHSFCPIHAKLRGLS